MPVAGAFVVPHPPLIFPEIGHGEQFRIQKTIDSYREVAKRIAIMQPETIVIISPHSIMYRDYFHISPGVHASGNFSRYGYPGIILEADYDEALVKVIEQEAQGNKLPAGTEGEREKELDHATMIPLRFIKEAYLKKFKIVRIGLSGLALSEHYRLGQTIRAAAEKAGRRIVVVASGDLSHRLSDSGPYEYAKEGPEYDRRITEILAKGELSKALEFSEDFCEKAGECGHRSISIMAGCMAGIPLEAELLSYEGPFGVGYAVAAFQDAYVSLARQSLKYYLKKGNNLPLPDGLPEELLKKKAGAFVSLKKYGNLRGCIGTIQGTKNCVAEEVIENAVSAGLWDPRFPQVEATELDNIICTVDILSVPEPITSIEELDVNKYGVIISMGDRRGLLLPKLEGVEMVEEQINIALKKAGIEEEDYRDGKCILERFEVVRHY
ncbi:MAG: AmmeMemoRadiSam system protein A [Clostridiales bacterium]|nr:AmmeMemoRadiSam system protein A [Clostridiales bacterium]